jgi:hypothetical protein
VDDIGVFSSKVSETIKKRARTLVNAGSQPQSVRELVRSLPGTDEELDDMTADMNYNPMFLSQQPLPSTEV